MLGPSRWVVIAATSPSGKTLFVCQCCGRIAPTPDKACPGVLIDGTPRVLPLHCIEWEHRQLVKRSTEFMTTARVAANARAAVREGDEVFEKLDEKA
jgi:hypothetical protein